MRPTSEVVFDSHATSIDAIKKAAYRLMDKLTVDIFHINTTVKAILYFDSKASKHEIETLVDEFRKEVLDQDLRASIKSETEAVRNLILAHAFSKTSLIRDD